MLHQDAILSYTLQFSVFLWFEEDLLRRTEKSASTPVMLFSTPAIAWLPLLLLLNFCNESIMELCTD